MASKSEIKRKLHAYLRKNKITDLDKLAEHVAKHGAKKFRGKKIKDVMITAGVFPGGMRGTGGMRD